MTREEAEALIADLTTEEKRLLHEFILSMRSSPNESSEAINRAKRDTAVSINEIIDDVHTPAEAIERIGCLLASIKNSMDGLDRAYFSNSVPKEHEWPEVGGSFHSLQMSVSFVLMIIDELVDRFHGE